MKGKQNVLGRNSSNGCNHRRLSDLCFLDNKITEIMTFGEVLEELVQKRIAEGSDPEYIKRCLLKVAANIL